MNKCCDQPPIIYFIIAIICYLWTQTNAGRTVPTHWPNSGLLTDLFARGPYFGHFWCKWRFRFLNKKESNSWTLVINLREIKWRVFTLKNLKCVLFYQWREKNVCCQCHASHSVAPLIGNIIDYCYKSNVNRLRSVFNIETWQFYTVIEFIVRGNKYAKTYVNSCSTY